MARSERPLAARLRRRPKAPEDVRPYLPQGGFGHVLITSRNPSWRRMAEGVVLDLLSAEEAVAFLSNRTGQSDLQAASELAGRLGLPGTRAGRRLHRGNRHRSRRVPAAVPEAPGRILRGQGPRVHDDSRDHLGGVPPPCRGSLPGSGGPVAPVRLSPRTTSRISSSSTGPRRPERLASRVADPLGLNATVAVLRAHSWCGPTGNRCPCTVWSRP